ncbi:MAG: SMC family ATPase [Chitinophagaceae bacterium]|nr:SMC family ATPase [Chitinophagaceae bacterium]
MILKSLILRNYKQYKNLELIFKEGLVGIIGKNGAGKSTIFDAILYCLFGKDEDKKELVRSTYSDAKSTVELVLEFELELQTYIIMRSYKGKALSTSAELYKGDELIAKDTRPVNEQVCKLLNMERDAFKRSVFSGQKELGELSEATGEARKKMIRKMVGLEKLDEIQTTINSDNKALKNQIIGQTQNLLSTEALNQKNIEVKELQQLIDEKIKEKNQIFEVYTAKEKEYTGIKDILSKEEIKYNKHIEYHNTLSKTETRIEELEKNIQDLNSKKIDIEKIDIECKRIAPQILSFENEKKELAEMQQIYDKILRRNHYSTQQKIWKDGIPAIEDKIKELEVRFLKLDELKANSSNNDVKLKLEKEKKESLQVEKQNILNQISLIKGKINDRIEKINKIQNIGKNGQCPTCFQSIRNVYEQTIKNMNDEISNYENQIVVENKSKLSNVESLLVNLEIQITHLENKKQEFLKEITVTEQFGRQLQVELNNKNGHINKISELQKEIDAFGELKLDREKYENYKQKIQNFDNQYIEYKKKENYVATELPNVKNAISFNQNNINTCREEIKKIKEAIIELSFSNDYFESVKAQKAIVESQVSEIKDSLHQKEIEIKDIGNKKEQVEQIIKNHFEIIKQIEDKKYQIDLLEKLSSIIGEFKTNILEKISPTISFEASSLFNKITKGRYENINVDENFDFYILDNAKYYPISRFSGGEIDLANFCLRIAITKAISELSGSQNTLNFLAFDEVFGSQDEDRRYEILSALNFLQEQFRQIYIISHVETVKEYFPNILEVSLESDGSLAKYI